MITKKSEWVEERKGGEGGLVALAVGEGCEGAGEEGGEGEAAEGDPQLGDGGAFEVEGADDLVEVARRDEVGDGLRPSGMEEMGVNSPPMSWKIMMQANMMKMHWSMLSELLAMATARPNMKRLKMMAAA